MSTGLAVALALSSGLLTAVVVIAADQLRRFSNRTQAQLDRLDARLGLRLDATDARISDLEDASTQHGERLAGLEVVAGLPLVPRFGRRRTH